MNLAPFFNSQFFDDDGSPLSSGKLYTYASGTTTPQTTYQDQAGASPNANPIILDAAGRCDLWLTSGVEYTFLLKRSDASTVASWDDVAGVAAAGDSVTSVNTQTGTVVLTADDIGFTTGTATSWFVGTDVGAALDDIIARVDTGFPASSVTITDAGSHFTASNVEAALQEVAGSFTLANPGSATLFGGLIIKWGTSSSLPADDATNAVSFAAAFPNAAYVVLVSPATDNGVSAGAPVKYSLAATALTVNGFNIVNDGDSATTAHWIALGK